MSLAGSSKVNNKYENITDCVLNSSKFWTLMGTYNDTKLFFYSMVDYLDNN